MPSAREVDNMPVNVFGAGAIQTAYVSWAEYELDSGSVPLELVWPNSYLSNPNVVPLFLSIDNSNNNSTGVILPNAEFVSVGQNVIVYNNSAHNFFLYSNSNAILGTITPDNAFYFILTDNTTVGGSWQGFAFGTGTVPVNVSALAGYGLTTLAADSNTTLNEQISTNLVNAASYTIQVSDRAKAIIGTASSGQNFTFPVPSTANLVSNFFGYIANPPSVGTITVYPSVGSTLNNDVTQLQISISPGDSLMYVYDTSTTTPTWWTFSGRGLPTVLPIAQGGTGAITASSAFANLAPAPSAGAIMCVTNGTNWNSPLANAAQSGSSLLSNVTSAPFSPSWGALSIIQIQQTIIDNTSAAGFTNTIPAILEGATPADKLEVVITPTFANSKVLIMATANIGADPTGTGGALILARNGAPIDVGTGGGTSNNTCNFLNVENASPYTFFYLDTPVSTIPVTYSVLANTYNVAKEYYFNTEWGGSTNFVNSSNIIAIEIGGL